MKARWLPFAALMSTCFTVGPAHAFCGFFVTPEDAPVTNSASLVALMRVGTRTVMSMSNDYRGPAKDFAMVVPVPVVLKETDVKTLEKNVFEHLEALSAPRLVEYWEQDPCTPPRPVESPKAGAVGGGGAKASPESEPKLGVTVEAQFAVGEYQIVILGAKESEGLETWLTSHGYKLPKGAAAALAPYVKEQQKFFVAKVDVSKLQLAADGSAQLSPLRISYESPDFRLPVRLGLLNAAANGKQDLVIFVLGENQRYEAANYKNVFAPTNIDVSEATKQHFSSFYASMFDHAMSTAGGKGVVTEYAWSTESCDPCPTPPLAASELATLGADVAVGIREVPEGALATATGEATAKPTFNGAVSEGEQHIARNRWRFQACHRKALVGDPFAAGKVTLTANIDGGGGVSQVRSKSSTAAAALTECTLNAIRSLHFTGGPATLTLDVDYVSNAKSAPGDKMVKILTRPASFTLTRLHTRYDANTLGDDLVFRVADHVVGGRETTGEGSSLETGARAWHFDNFQTRYAIRHAWTGPITCAKPVRGIWGGPPGANNPSDAGSVGSSTPAVATGLAKTPRDVKAGDFVLAGMPGLPPAGVVPKVAAPVVPSAVPSAAPTPEAKKSCGCETVGHAGDGWLSGLFLGLALFLRRRR